MKYIKKFENNSISKYFISSYLDNILYIENMIAIYEIINQESEQFTIKILYTFDKKTKKLIPNNDNFAFNRKK